MNVFVRKYTASDLKGMTEVWNYVVREGNAFPKTQELTAEGAEEFFSSQTYCGAAIDTDSGKVVGMYILHPNNIGRCGHICNEKSGIWDITVQRRGQHQLPGASLVSKAGICTSGHHTQRFQT